MTTPTYPPLDEARLRIIAMHLADDKDYLNHPSCPYHKSTVEMFVKPTSTENDKVVNDVDRQMAILLRMREQMETQADRLDSDSLDTSAANAYFRQRLTIEREIIELESQLHNIENVDAFFAAVLQIMEDVLETDQRDEVMNKLRSIKEKKSDV